MYDNPNDKNNLKEAADQYPLKIDFDDWEVLFSKIKPTDATTRLKTKDGKFKRKSANLFLMFFSLASIFTWKQISDPNVDAILPAKPKTHQLTEAAPPAGPATNIKTNATRPAKSPAPFSKDFRNTSFQNNFSGRIVQSGHVNDAQMRHFFNSKTTLMSSTDIERPIKNLAQMSVDIYGNSVAIPPLRKKHFYAGMGAGLDASTVSRQAFKKAGMSVGLIAGKYLSNSISVEAGVIFGRRYYYTSGKYFSMNKVGPNMPSGMQIMEVNGMFTSLQFPVKMKYDFQISPKQNLFVTAGLQANLILKETNDYMVMYNSLMSADKGTYTKNYFAPLSGALVSIGMERQINSKLVLRIEPYHSIPLRKSGMGEINVQHTGANIILMHSRDRRN